MCGIHSDIFWYIFLHVERAMVFCVVFFTCGTRSDILCYIFSCLPLNSVSFAAFIASSYSSLSSYIFKKAELFRVASFRRVEFTLVFCVIFFRLWNALWYFVLYLSAFGM